MRPALDIAGFEQLLDSPDVHPADDWRAVPVRVPPEEMRRLESLCTERHLLLVDTIERQLADLAQVRFPASRDSAERKRCHEAARAASCTWMYVPWERHVVHLLDADDYFEVITDRNRDKITREEQRLLRTKRVGVVGLSVGGEAALTVAQEHLCGAMVLADFDGLDLSNLNRLGAGFSELGVNKARIVARRIARIDPWLDVTILEDGVTHENLPAFLNGLDLLIEECDDLRMKWEVRRLAKARGLDIVFAGDERGFLSIEPHGSAPELAVFHGRIASAPLPRHAHPDPVTFMRSLAEWLGGWDALSDRSRQSLLRIGDDICGYPQLAGEARQAAAQVAHVARRLLLGEPLRPMLAHQDMEAWIGG